MKILPLILIVSHLFLTICLYVASTGDNYPHLINNTYLFTNKKKYLSFLSFFHALI